MWVSIKDVRNGLGLKNITKKKTKTPWYEWVWLHIILNWCLFYWISFSRRNWWKRSHWQRSYFWGKKVRSIRKKLGYKFIRINKIKEDYDADYEASRIQTFISKFRDRQLKKLYKKLKELGDKIKELTS